MAMTVAKMVDRILNKIDDDSYDNDDVLDSLNRCAIHIASVITIKELATVGTVTAGAGDNTVSLPSDFQKNLVHAYNKTTGERIEVRKSRRLVDRYSDNPNTSGNVVVVCNDYPNLYFKNSPSSDQEIDLYYHRKPDEITFEDNIFPPYIPESHVFKLFYNYALNELYDEIEDGIDGEKVNTKWHESKFEKFLLELDVLIIGPDPDEAYQPLSTNPNFDFEDF